MKKRRMSFRIENDEAVVIAPVEFWYSLERYYRELAQEYKDEASYHEGAIEAADLIADWVERTRDKRESSE